MITLKKSVQHTRRQRGKAARGAGERVREPRMSQD